MTIIHLFLKRPPPISTLFPYTTLFRSHIIEGHHRLLRSLDFGDEDYEGNALEVVGDIVKRSQDSITTMRSEEHTSELQSHVNLVCRLLLEKKKHKRCIDVNDTRFGYTN